MRSNNLVVVLTAIGAVHHRTLTNKSDGTFPVEELKRKIRNGSDPHFPVSSLVCLENTHNGCNGSALPIEFIDEVRLTVLFHFFPFSLPLTLSLTKVCETAHSRGVRVHMDGARLFNASIITGLPVSRLVRDCDSVSICLSKVSDPVVPPIFA